MANLLQQAGKVGVQSGLAAFRAGSLRYYTGSAFRTAEPAVQKRLTLFTPGMVVIPPGSSEVNELFQGLHAKVKSSSGERLAKLGLFNGTYTPPKYFDPKFLGNATFRYLQPESQFTQPSGKVTTAYRELDRFIMSFSRQVYEMDKEKHLASIQTTFGASKEEAQRLLDFIIELDKSFREEHGLNELADVRFVVNSLTQFVDGPVEKGSVLLHPHKDGPEGGLQSTLLYRGPEDRETPLHEVVMVEENGNITTVASGFVVFNMVLHHVQASDASGVDYTVSFAIGIEKLQPRSMPRL